MTYQFVELSESGTSDAKLLDTGETRISATRAFYAYDNTPVLSAVANIQEIVNSSQLPQIGDLHPDYNGLRVTARQVQRDSEREDAYKISYSYEYLPAPPTDGGGNNDAQIQESSEASAQFMDFYRSQGNQPVSYDSPTAVDIGGTKIDAGGKPTSLIVRQQTWSVSYEHYGSLDVATPFAITGKRNEREFFGFRKGSLVYLGMSFSTKSASSYNITHKFLYDSVFHLRQVPDEFDGDLLPTLDSDGHVSKVIWIQPFPSTEDFKKIGIPSG
jgi:hypothetical protein